VPVGIESSEAPPKLSGDRARSTQDSKPENPCQEHARRFVRKPACGRDQTAEPKRSKQEAPKPPPPDSAKPPGKSDFLGKFDGAVRRTMQTVRDCVVESRSSRCLPMK